ncbi:PREDICTED: late cornified envelope protein 3D-like [Hipposideros armiger]|uniref:Late cornified envelope protein 3D-like n=1 Tax=Hipposideros armiger TaxID=186990 RepID=A0A8B7Q6U3_HIPAR|nr:PREDICTED: late cornified envelope protein 3D-like [Hipposideros armiger]
MSCQQNQQQCQPPPKCPSPKCPPKCLPKSPAQCLPPAPSGCGPSSGGGCAPSSEGGCFLSHHRHRRSHRCRIPVEDSVEPGEKKHPIEIPMPLI